MDPGYFLLWHMEQRDGECCLIKLDHINPGQIVKARFIMDCMPSQLPEFACPMKDLKIRRAGNEMLPVVMRVLLHVLAPEVMAAFKFKLK